VVGGSHPTGLCGVPTDLHVAPRPGREGSGVPTSLTGPAIEPDAPVDQPSVVLPSTYSEAFRLELRRAFSPPYEAPLVVVLNAALVCVCWFLLPVPLQDLIFSLHGVLAFPIVLSVWMLADVPATNLLGSDATRMLAAIDDPDALQRLIYAKNAVLWLLVAPVCSLVALAIGLAYDDWKRTVVTIIGILVIPIGSLGIAAWLGIVYPYHTLSLADRWEHRRPVGRMLVRWITLAILPYAIVPAIVNLLAAPAFFAWVLTSGHWGVRIHAGDLAIGVAVTIALSTAAFFLGHRTGLRMIHRRRTRLVEYLSHPQLG
jgi:hypothetical protein